MTKFKRIINGECHFEMIELFDDVEKASNTQNRGELIECNIDNLRLDFTKVKKEHDGTNPNASAEAEGSTSEETREVSGSETESK
tara:strand:+ start:269 stop:523 length:255 start_codon:yes stop_codon:yes gene_type:complete